MVFPFLLQAKVHAFRTLEEAARGVWKLNSLSIKSTEADIKNALIYFHDGWVGMSADHGQASYWWCAVRGLCRPGLWAAEGQQYLPCVWALSISQDAHKSLASAIQPSRQRMLTNDGWPSHCYVRSMLSCHLHHQPQRSRADQSQGIYSCRARLKEEKFFPFRSLWHSPWLFVVPTNYLGRIFTKCLQKNITAGRFFPDALLRCRFICDKSVWGSH